MRNAAASPQIKPAPALVARRAKRMPNTRPNAPPTAMPWVIGVPSARLCNVPPPRPTPRPRAGPIRTELFGLVSTFSNANDLVADILLSLLSQIDGLNNIFWEKQLHRPVHQYANLAFQSRQLAQINAPPHQPCQQSRKTHGLVAHEWDRQFGAGGLMSDHTQSPEGVEVEAACPAAL